MSERALVALPCVVGITGHRRIAAPDRLTGDLEREMTGIAATLPACRPVLLSALAAGADQIAAHVALAAGWQLVAVLPFPPGDPRHGFSAAEQQEFDGLLAQASHWINAAALAGIDPAAPDEAHFLAAGRWPLSGGICACADFGMGRRR